MIKKTLVIISSGFVLFAFCGKKCENEPPNVTLVNHGTTKADIQIKTSNGNTENVNGIEPNIISAARSFASGKIEFTVAIKDVPDPVVYVLEAQDCKDYVVTINPDNTVTSAGTERDK